MESRLSKMRDEEVKEEVRKAYGMMVRRGGTCCPSTNCCGNTDRAADIGKSIGYTQKELDEAPVGSNLGLGCGNPIALASLQEGETVLDLGSGAGFDCFLAAKRVGDSGKVIGVDMTKQMIEKAEENALSSGSRNVEFRLGEIENLPVANDSVDVIISNCVINLVPDKKKAFREAYRVLKPGGRLMISDLALLHELPSFIKDSIQAYVGCLSGAILKDEYISAIREAGFSDIAILEEVTFPVDLVAGELTAVTTKRNVTADAVDRDEILDSVVSIRVQAVKSRHTGESH